MKHLRLLALAAITIIALSIAPSRSAMADEPAIRHHIMVVEYDHGHSRLLEVSAEGKLVWEQKLPSLAVMFQPMANGNVVYAHAGKPPGATEIDRKGTVVWDFVSKATEVLACERLPNGNTLVGEEGPCRIVEVDPKGQIVSTINLTAASMPHHQLRRFHQLADGHILAALEGDGIVREVDRNGKVVWEYKGLENVFEALRLKNGNTLIGGGTQKRVLEVTPEGKTVWELKAGDVPELNLVWITSLQVLPNGDFVIGNFLRGHEGMGAHAFEMTPEKKVVWQFADHSMLKSSTCVVVMDP